MEIQIVICKIEHMHCQIFYQSKLSKQLLYFFFVQELNLDTQIAIPERNIDNSIRNRSDLRTEIYHAFFQNIRNYKRDGM
jgi:hypothetical protein